MGDEAVEVREARRRDVEVPLANVVNGLIVNLTLPIQKNYSTAEDDTLSP